MKYCKTGNVRKFIKTNPKKKKLIPRKKEVKLIKKVNVKKDIYVSKKIEKSEIKNNKQKILKEECWLTPQAIKFLGKYIPSLPKMKILEFGSGGSTLWFSKFKNVQIDSVEHNLKWYNIVKYNLEILNRKNVSLHLLEQPYDTICNILNKKYNFILVDGRDRVKCFKKAIHLLMPKGVIMLDNSDREYYNEIESLMLKLKWKKTKTFHEWGTSWWVCCGK